MMKTLCILAILIFSAQSQLISQRKYIPEYSDPFTEHWRWKKLSTLDSEKIEEFTVDFNGNAWFLNNNQIIKYDGHTYKYYKLPRFFYNGKLSPLHDGIAVNFTQGIYLFKDTAWIHETLGLDQLKPYFYKTLSIDKDFFIGVSSKGIYASKNNKKYFYSTEDIIKKIEKVPSIHFVSFDRNVQLSSVFYDVYRKGNQLVFYNTLVGDMKAVINPDSSDEPFTFQNFKSTYKVRLNPQSKIINTPDSVTWVITTKYTEPAFEIKNGNKIAHDMNNLFGDLNFHSDIVYMDDGTIILAGQGQIYAYKNNKWKRYRMPDIPISSLPPIKMHKTNDGNLLIGGFKTEIYIFQFLNKEFCKLNNITYQTTDNQNNKWFIDKSRKIVVNNGNQWWYHNKELNPIELPTRVYAAKNGWILSTGTHNNKSAIAFLQKGIWKHITFPACVKDIDKHSVYVDNSEQLWISSSLQGMPDATVNISKQFIDNFLNSEELSLHIIEDSLLPSFVNNNSIPGIIEAEYYDFGGEGVAYNDHTSNFPKLFRIDDGVDVMTSNRSSGGFFIGSTGQGEWMNYTITKGEPGDYRFTYRVSNRGSDTSKIKVLINNKQVDIIEVERTDLGEWIDISTENVIINNFPSVLRVEYLKGIANFDFIEINHTNDKGKNKAPHQQSRQGDKNINLIRQRYLGNNLGPNKLFYNIINKRVGLVDEKKDIKDLNIKSVITHISDFNNKIIWIGTQNDGIYRYKNSELKNFTMANGLPSNVIVNLFADNDSSVWVATEKNINRFDGETWITNCFPEEFSIESHGGEIQVDKDGNIWISVLPKNWTLQKSLVSPATRVSDSKISQDQERPFFCIRVVPDKNPPVTHIDFFSPIVEQDGNTHIKWSGSDLWNQTNPEELLFSFKLNNKQWSNFENKLDHTFLSLPGGKYKLELRAKDKYGNISTSNDIIAFEVKPPIWKRTWFVLLVSTFILITLYLISRLIVRNKNLFAANIEIENQAKEIKEANILLEQNHQEILTQTEAIHQLKIRFFTNISHEFRTPLSLIITPIEELSKMLKPQTHAGYLAGMVQRNVKKLLRLVNQLLDFRKIETDSFKLKVSKGNLIEIINEIVADFELQVKTQGIQLSVSTNEATNSEHWFDHDILGKVLTNLVSNAFKFTPKGGKIVISVHIKNALANISVSDTGIGISKDNIELIFDRFYSDTTHSNQLYDGMGIGLSMCKRLIEIHKGSITVESEKNKGASFNIELSISKESYKTEEIVSKSSPQKINEIVAQEFSVEESSTIPELKKRIDHKENMHMLIVEDNTELREYLTKHFGYYNIKSAVNGKVAFDIAQETIPDVIISDLMMPVMDGLQLCHKIRTTHITSHIPFILLTAKTKIEYQIQGLESGADAYISKPFSLLHLETQVNNLIRQRKILREKFSNNLDLKFNEAATNNSDAEFFNKVEKVIEENMTNPDFTVEKLAEKLNYSRIQLYRKLKAISNNNPSELLRLKRLKLSAELIKQKKFTMSQIAYEVGFSSNSHFNNAFKNHYGKTPKEYQRDL